MNAKYPQMQIQGSKTLGIHKKCHIQLQHVLHRRTTYFPFIANILSKTHISNQ